ncbi:MAG: UDP-3-O-acyl-N-acetylglucosamine deacetylase [Caulobacteraceae bacterium]|nr:UDP-3-O-acyl-N-acetylglucosamine deacetylase [Caulobacteraceae bacterium]
MILQSQQTLARPFTVSGVGLHSGAPVTVQVRPAVPGAGIGFMRTDVSGRDPLVRARVEAVRDTRLGTTIANADGTSVSTVEHFMAVFGALGIDNALVCLDGPEAPILDGSCAPLVELVDGAGRRTQPAARRRIEILSAVTVTDGDKRATLAPAEGFELSFHIDFPDPAIGRQTVELAMSEAIFRREIADCRTFGFLADVEALRAAGLARGGSLDNVIVVDGGRVVNPRGLRRRDEFVRHKVLDAMGDLYLLGAPILGRYEGIRSGHGLNTALARALLASPSSWRYAEDLAARARPIAALA